MRRAEIVAFQKKKKNAMVQTPGFPLMYMLYICDVFRNTVGIIKAWKRMSWEWSLDGGHKSRDRRSS